MVCCSYTVEKKGQFLAYFMCYINFEAQHKILIEIFEIFKGHFSKLENTFRHLQVINVNQQQVDEGQMNEPFSHSKKSWSFQICEYCIYAVISSFKFPQKIGQHCS